MGVYKCVSSTPAVSGVFTAGVIYEFDDTGAYIYDVDTSDGCASMWRLSNGRIYEIYGDTESPVLAVFSEV